MGGFGWAKNINFAGPGRQPGYFLFKAQKKVTKERALHLQWAGTGYLMLPGGRLI
jgi:hypothetical protein